MSSRCIAGVAVALAALFVGNAQAYPGGTPSFQTDVAPYCASCHASREAAVLEGAGERADKEVAERKHLSLVLAGEKGTRPCPRPTASRSRIRSGLWTPPPRFPSRPPPA